MRKDFLFIMFLIWMGFLAGCRASKESKARIERTAESEIGVELRRVDSLWSSIAERLTMKIEFYPPMPGNVETPTTEDLGIGTHLNEAKKSLFQAAPFGQTAGSLYRTDGAAPSSEGFEGFGGLGSVKSIEISAERSEDRSRIAATDSVLEQKATTTETLQEDKSLGARQDNGTVVGLAIVAAVAFIVALLIVLKKFWKK